MSVTVVVRYGINLEKNTAMRGPGARVIEYGADYDEAVAKSERLLHRNKTVSRVAFEADERSLDHPP